VPELRNDATEDGFHEIQFSRKELVFLFMAASVALIFVFLAGVLVGRDAASKAPEPSISSAEEVVPPATLPSQPDEPPQPTKDQPVTTAESKLSYPELLAGDGKQKPKDEPRPVEPPKAAAPPPAAAAKPEAAPVADQGPKVPTSGRPGVWVIQISALKTRQPAAEWVQRLIDKGYPAFLENAAPGVFRVRVGRYKERREADQIARRLEKEEQLKPNVSR